MHCASASSLYTQYQTRINYIPCTQHDMKLTINNLTHTVSMDSLVILAIILQTRRPASADRTVCRQFQATGQPASRTQASDAMTSRLPRYEAKCVQRRCFQWGSVPLRSDIQGTELMKQDSRHHMQIVAPDRQSPQHPITQFFSRLDALPDTQPTVSKH